MTAAPKIPDAMGKKWVSLDDPFSFPMTFLTIDVDRVFIRFLEMGVRHGLITKRMREIFIEDYATLFLESLASDTSVVGLDIAKRKRVLDGWLRATVLKFENVGESKKEGRRLVGPHPLHLGVIRSGLPTNQEYLIRKADVWTYFSAICVPTQGEEKPENRLDRILRSRLGKGLQLDKAEYHSDEPRYDEVTPIDVNSLIALRLLSKFTSARPGEDNGPDAESWPTRPWVDQRRYMPKRPAGFAEAPVFVGNEAQRIEHLVITPNAFKDLGVDIVNVLSSYEQLDGSELTQHCLALLSFRLYRSPLLAAHEIRGLVAGVTTHEEYGDAPQIYCDFSDGRDEGSVELSKRCVSRDLEIHRVFFRDRIHLRVLDWLGKLLDAETQMELSQARARGVNAYYRKLVELRPTEELKIAARFLLGQFKTAVSASEDDEESNSKWRELLEQWRAEGADEVSQLMRVMLTAARPGGRAPAQMEQWCWTTGGMLNELPHRPYALLAGSVKHRTTWRYAPTDQLLTALLLGCFVPERPEAEARSAMRFSELLELLRTRYGITVDQPPTEFVDADTSRAAERNRSHFARKLQLIGCLEGLSDDSQFQMVTRPR